MPETDSSATEAGAGRLFLATLLGTTLIGPLAIHMFLPAIPAVQQAFEAPVATAQATFSIALFTMACATLVYGSLSDRFGRRPVMLAGLILFTVGALIAALATSIPVLLTGRFLQGAGAAGGVVLARAILRDVYGIDRLVKAIAYLTAAYVLGPMLAPALGGFLIDAFGWRAEFTFATVCGTAIIVLAWFSLRETHLERGPASSLAGMARGYGRLLRSPRFCAFALQPGFASGAFFALSSSVAVLSTEKLGISASEFGLYFMSFPIGFMTGNVIAGRLSGRVAIETMILVGCTVTLGAIIFMVVLLALDGITLLALFVPGGLHTFGQGLSQPSSNSGAISTDPDLAGTASGVVVFLQFFLGAALSQLVGFLADGTATPTMIVVCTATAFSFLAGTTPMLLKWRDTKRRASL